MNINDFPKPHILDKLPIENLSCALQTDRDFLSEMIRAEKCLSEFIGYLNNLPTPNILITSLTSDVFPERFKPVIDILELVFFIASIK